MAAIIFDSKNFITYSGNTNIFAILSKSYWLTFNN